MESVLKILQIFNFYALSGILLYFVFEFCRTKCRTISCNISANPHKS